jgi:hypothetical protein
MTLNGKWMEVFRAGDYGPKGKFTAADLDKIIANYDPAKHEAPLTIGHPEHDAPAYGWAEALRRTGDVLFAKLKQVPDAIDHLVSEGRFKKRSISLYNGANGPSLRHIGLLGAMPPEVKGLADLKLCEFGQDKFESFDFKEEGLTIEEMKAAFSEAIRNLFGDKKPAVFSEDDVKRISLEAAKEANKDLQTKFTELQTKFNDSETKRIAAEAAAAVSGKVTLAETAIAKLKADGKWIPAFDKMGAVQIFTELAKSDVKITFGEGDKKIEKTALQLFADFLGGLPQIVPIKELTSAAASARKGNLIKFSEPAGNSGVAVDEESVLMAEAAQELATKEKITYGEALKRVRAQGVKKEGDSSAAAV